MKRLKKIIKHLGIGIIVLTLSIVVLGYLDIGNKYIESEQGGFRLLEIGDNSIRILQKGEGKDIILIHGTPGSIEDWTPIIEPLAKKYRVTAFDRLGHGYSTHTNYNYQLKDNAELVAQIIKKLDLQSPMIIGHSYGGSTAAYLMTNHYNDSLKYVIIDAPLFTYEVSDTDKLLSIPFLGKGVAFIANYTIAEQPIEDGIKASLANQNKASLQSLVNERKQIWLQPKVLYSNAKESVNYPSDLDKISGKYNTISSDLLIITGEDDKKTYRSECQKFSDLVLTDSLIILKNVGHYIQLDKADDIARIIDEKMK
ncbi:alpha/beta fold hydrolase [Flagellimonas flava]|uniref:Pimeloyl-ACP methyl ester carboxylesterase n=1 Tax=Flagellimonas flava TaxID=570519 RepID=A0A1M5P7U8_9FLAO|nr:alpha/beta hydrolase [Allomuricauda flava]SHG97876.1 Pimeloyl-ACP methyl ester carboxylesterase [Allomuricauda flava]